MPDAGEDSAAQMETDGVRILKDCPCCCKTRWRRREILSGDAPFDGTRGSPRGSGRNAITAQQFCSSDSGENLIGRDGISKTVVWRKCASSGELRSCETFPVRHAGADCTSGAFFINDHHDRRRIDAHRAGCSADGGCSTQIVWRNRTGGTLADRGTGRAGKRCHAVCQRRFPDFGKTGRDLAEGAAPRRIGARSQRAAHGDAGTRPAKMRRRGIRLPALPSRLLSVLAVLSAADPVPDHPARPARPARAPAGVHHLLDGSGDFDLERAAPAGAAGQLGPHHPSWPAGKPADAAAGQPGISRGARPDRAGERASTAPSRSRSDAAFR